MSLCDFERSAISVIKKEEEKKKLFPCAPVLIQPPPEVLQENLAGAVEDIFLHARAPILSRRSDRRPGFLQIPPEFRSVFPPRS
jgi:hypothetical protein